MLRLFIPVEIIEILLLFTRHIYFLETLRSRNWLEFVAFISISLLLILFILLILQSLPDELTPVITQQNELLVNLGYFLGTQIKTSIHQLTYVLTLHMNQLGCLVS